MTLGYRKSIIFSLLLATCHVDSALCRETDQKEYDRSCKHWLEDAKRIEEMLKHGQPIRIFANPLKENKKPFEVIDNAIRNKKRHVFILDNDLKCVFTEYSLEEIKDIRFELVMYDLCKFLGFGNVPPVVWRDNFVIDGKRHRGTLQLFFEKTDIEGYDEDNISRSMAYISQKELDEYRIFNLLFGTWEPRLERLAICGGTYLVHDNASNMRLQQEFEKFGEVPFVCLHDFGDNEVSEYTKACEEAIKKNEEALEQEKLRAKQERAKMRKELEKQKIVEEKKLLEVKQAFQKQKDDYYRQQKEFAKQQAQFLQQQQNQQFLLGQNPQVSPGYNIQVFPAQPAFQQNPPQQNPAPQQYDPFANVPEPTNPQLDYINQQIKFLDEQDELADAEVVEPFPFETALHLNDGERSKIAALYKYSPPAFEQKYIIWKRNYWFQFAGEKAQHDIKYVLFPRFLTGEMKDKVESLNRVRVLECFLKNRYYRMQKPQIQEFFDKCIPFVDAIMCRRRMLLNFFKAQEEKIAAEATSGE